MEWFAALFLYLLYFLMAVGPPVAIAVVLVVLYRRGFFSKIRRIRASESAMAHGASVRGWNYQPSGNPWLVNVTAPPFGMGDAQRVVDVVRGSRAAGPFVAFMLELIIHSEDDRNQRVRRWRIVSIPLPQAIPRIALTPDGPVAAFLGAEVLERGAHDVEVESHAFNERWRAGTDDLDCAHAVLTPAVIAALLDAPYDVACIIIENGNLVAASNIPVLDVAWIDQTLDTLESVRAGIPQFAWDKWGIADRGSAPNVGHD